MRIGLLHIDSVSKLAARYERLWPLLVAIVPQCRRTVFWDNSSDDGPIEIAAYREGPADYPPRWPTWTPEVVAELH